MNAELALFLIEKGIPVAKAKDIAAEAVSLSDIALGIMDALPGAMSVAEAKEMASYAPLVVDMASGTPQPSRSDSAPVFRQPEDGTARAVVHRVSVVGPDGLTDVQRAAVGTVGLCPNCQQPRTSHLPGCAVASGENPRAVTKAPLPPVQ